MWTNMANLNTYTDRLLVSSTKQAVTRQYNKLYDWFVMTSHQITMLHVRWLVERWISKWVVAVVVIAMKAPGLQSFVACRQCKILKHFINHPSESVFRNTHFEVGPITHIKISTERKYEFWVAGLLACNVSTFFLHPCDIWWNLLLLPWIAAGLLDQHSIGECHIEWLFWFTLKNHDFTWPCRRGRWSFTWD